MQYRFTEGLITEFGNTVLVEMYKNGKPVGLENRMLLDELEPAIAEVERFHTLPYGDAVIISGVPTFAHTSIALALEVKFKVIATHYLAAKGYLVIKSRDRERFPIGYLASEVDHNQGKVIGGGD